MNLSIKDIYEKIGIFIEKRTLIILLAAFLLIFVSFYGAVPLDPAVLNSIVNSLPGTIKDRYVLGSDLGILNLKIDQNLKTEQIAALIENVKSDIEWYPPPIGVSTTVTDRQVTMTSVLDALTSGRTAMGYLGLTLIFFGLLVVYRDWLKAFVPILPILMVTGWSGGVILGDMATGESRTALYKINVDDTATAKSYAIKNEIKYDDEHGDIQYSKALKATVNVKPAVPFMDKVKESPTVLILMVLGIIGIPTYSYIKWKKITT